MNTPAVMRGIGQVMLQNNSYAGALFLLGLLVSSRRAFLLAVLGSLTGCSWPGAWGRPSRPSIPARSVSTAC